MNGPSTTDLTYQPPGRVRDHVIWGHGHPRSTAWPYTLLMANLLTIRR